MPVLDFGRSANAPFEAPPKVAERGTLHLRLRALEFPVGSEASFDREVDAAGQQGADFRLSDLAEVFGERTGSEISSERLVGVLYDLRFDRKVEL